MPISMPIFWWFLAGLVLVAELVTGTFYLLMIAWALAVGAVVAHAGLPVVAQLVAFAVVGVASTAMLYRRRGRRQAPTDVSRNPDVNSDVGERVQVDAWGADRTARVSYRGSVWTARLAPEAAAAAESGRHGHPGQHRIVAVEGNWLVLAPVPR